MFAKFQNSETVLKNQFYKNILQILKNLWIPLLAVCGYEFVTAVVSPLKTMMFVSSNSPFFSLNVSNDVRLYHFSIFMSFISFPAIFTGIFYGFLCDYFSVKKALHISFIALILQLILAGVAIWCHAYTSFVAVYCVAAFFVSLKVIVIIFVVKEPNMNKATVIGIVEFVIGIAFLVGPPIGGYLSQEIPIHPYAIIYFMCALPVLIVWRVSSKISYDKNKVDSKQEKHTFFKDLYNKKSIFNVTKNFSKKSIIIFILFILAHCMDQLSWGSFYQFFPSQMQATFHLSNAQVGLLTSEVGFGLLVATGLFLPLIEKWMRRENIMLLSAFFMVLASGLSWQVVIHPTMPGHALVVWGSMFVIISADVMAFCALVTLISDYTPLSMRGVVIGSLYMIRALMWALSSIVSSVVTDFWSHRYVLIGSFIPALLFFIIAIVIVFLSRQKINEQAQDAL